MTTLDRWHARSLAELNAGELLAFYRLTTLLLCLSRDDGVLVHVWQLYARIALWLPPAPTSRPRPRTM